eukprot:4653809-Amphidinium_carterae.1
MLLAGAERQDVAEWLAEEWQSKEPWVTREHCKEAARWICKSVHERADKRPSFSTIKQALLALRESVERCMLPDQPV